MIARNRVDLGVVRFNLPDNPHRWMKVLLTTWIAVSVMGAVAFGNGAESRRTRQASRNARVTTTVELPRDTTAGKLPPSPPLQP